MGGKERMCSNLTARCLPLVTRKSIFVDLRREVEGRERNELVKGWLVNI